MSIELSPEAMHQLVPVLLDKLIAPFLLGVIGWIVKDIFLDLFKERQKSIRNEQLYRLRDFYSPLFFWSGVAMFNAKEKPDQLGLKELCALMEKGATLLPQDHYYVFIKLIEALAGQPTTRPTQAMVGKARDYIYTQIEQLNFVLFRQTDDFDPAASVDIFRNLRRFFGFFLAGTVQVLLWAVPVILIFSLYYATSDNIAATICTVILLVLVVIAEICRRNGISKKMRSYLAAHSSNTPPKKTSRNHAQDHR